MKSSDLIVVATFRSTPDAQIAKGILDEAGIESMIRPTMPEACIQPSGEPSCWSEPKTFKRRTKR